MKNFVAFSLLLGSCSTLWAQSTEEQLRQLRSRIEQLEAQQEELLVQSQNQAFQVRSFLNDSLTFGGFLETAITQIEGPDTRLQVMNSSNVLGLNLAAEFSPRLRFVSQILTGLTNPLQNPHGNPEATAPIPDRREFGSLFFGALLSQGYVEYFQRKEFRLQAGLGYVPFGYAAQQRELVLFIRRSGPQILRTNHLFSALWNGVHGLGEFNVGRSHMGYNAYTMNPISDFYGKMMGGGGRLWWASPEDVVTAGISGQVGKYRGSTSEVYGADLRVRLQYFSVTTEFAQHQTEGKDPWSAYVEPAIHLNDGRWIFFVFGDYAQNARAELRTGPNFQRSDAHQKWEYGSGVNWLPTTNTRFRFTVTRHDYTGNTARVNGVDRDYYSVDVSAGVAF
jgi:hypothetical protein